MNKEKAAIVRMMMDLPSSQRKQIATKIPFSRGTEMRVNLRRRHDLDWEEQTEMD